MGLNDCPSDGGESDDPSGSEGTIIRGGNGESLSPGECLSLLANDRRRTFLLFLKRCKHDRVDVNAAVHYIAKKENQGSDGSTCNDTREPIHVSLLHHHIPKLEGPGVVEFDEENKQLVYDGDPILHQYLELTGELENFPG